MPSITVTRTRLDLRNGHRHKTVVLSVEHKSGHAVRRVFDLWKRHGMIEGGDRIIHTNAKGEIKTHTICLECKIAPQIENKELCATCTKERNDKHNFQDAPPSSSGLPTFSPGLLTALTEPNPNRKFYKFGPHEKDEEHPDNYKQLSLR